jgi:hypothetical protein
MKNEILERAMFAMPLSKDARNSGIMAGFEEEMPEDTEEEGMEEMPPMARTPQNPEILMNTLRGDMRSMDARYQELAQMVGEDAAMETPPEVLAMLQPQLAAPQAGIGGLPQAQGMMPPNMGMPPPDAGMPPPGMGMPPPNQMGAPQPAPAMPQGGISMPAGMESAPPFSPGAEAPQGYAIGGLVRGAQMVGDKLGQYGSAANAALGRMFMNPERIMTQPYLENVRGAGGRFTAEQIQRGGDVSLLTPTFTQGLQQGVARVAEQYPRLTSALSASPMAGMFATLPFVQGSSDKNRTAEQEKAYQDLVSQIPTGGYPPAPPADDPRRAGAPVPASANLGPQPSAFKLSFDGMATADADQAAIDQREVDAAAKVDTDPLGSFINQKLKTFDEREAKGKPLSKVDRIRKGQAEYAPLFEELLGSDKESAKINALLLLSEAGLKLASSTKPTFAMAVADSFAGVPRGVAAIAAQERELGIKTKSAALQQAISDVGAEDAAAAARQKVVLDYTMKMELEKAKQGGVIAKDGGAGLIVQENNKGSRIGVSLDPAYVNALKQNPIAVLFNDPDVNPFVRDVGAARTVVQQDAKQRVKLEEDLNQISGQLTTIRDMQNVVADAYSPGTFFTGVKNEYLVPLLPNAIVRPDLNKAQVTNTLKNGFSDLSRGRASQDGRLTNQQEKWLRDNDEAISKPDGLLQNPELAAKTLKTKETSLLNEWYSTATKLGIFDRDRVLSTPPTGTRNDPFNISADPGEQQRMYTFLANTFNTVPNPNTVVHVRMPNGKVQQYTASQLQGQVK